MCMSSRLLAGQNIRKCRNFLTAAVNYQLDSLVLCSLALYALIRPPAPPQGLLLIRLDAIGDFILWLAAAEKLRQLYHGEQIALIAHPAWADLARKLPFFDDVVAVDSDLFATNLAYRWKIIRLVRARGVKTVIQPTYSRKFLIGDSLVRATAAPERIGSEGDCSNSGAGAQRISDTWYTRRVPASSGRLMELARNAEFTRGLGGTDPGGRIVALPPVDELPALYRDSRYFIMMPGASWVGRQWPYQHFAHILRSVHEKTGWLGVLCGTGAEWSLCDKIIAGSGIQAINSSGDSTLTQFVEMVRNAQLLIGNESAGIHIAAAVQTPSVCILGGGHYGRFLPYPEGAGGVLPVPVVSPMECFGCNWHCTKQVEMDSPVPCLSAITVDQVLEAVWGIIADNERDVKMTAIT